MSPAYHLSIAGLGPHRQTDLALPEHAEIRAPSATGKSTTAAAVALLLTGALPVGAADLAAMTRADAAGVVDVELRRDGEPSLRYRRTASGATTWSLGLASATSAAARGRLVGPVGDPALAPLTLAILSPDRLLAQLLTPGDLGRSLRRALDLALPAQDARGVVSELLTATGGAPLAPAEPGDWKAANTARLAADRSLAVEAGALRQASAEPPPTPTTAAPASESVATAQATVEAAELWATYRRTAGASERRAQALAQAADWDRRLAALGPQESDDGAPPPPQLSNRAEAAAVDTAEAALAKLRATTAADSPPAKEAAARLVAAKAARADCVSCGAPVPPETRQRSIKSAEVQHAEELRLAGVRRTEAIAKAEAALDLARAALRAQDARVEQREAERRGHTEASLRRSAWTAGRKAIGERPVVPPAVEGEPEPPTCPEPSPADTVGARSVLAAAEAARLHAEQARLQAERRSAAVSAAQASHDVAAAKADRAAAVAKAWRDAPGVIARAGLEFWQLALEAVDEGARLRLVLPTEDAPAAEQDTCQVMVTGPGPELPLAAASRGRQLRAAVALSLTLRRLASTRHPGGALPYSELPVIVDGAQDWSYGWPLATAGGPVWLLRTVPTRVAGGLSVVAL